MIVLIGSKIDPHLVELNEHLKLLGHDCEILSTNREDLHVSRFHFYSEPYPYGYIEQAGVLFDTRKIVAAFCYQPLFVIENNFESQVEKFWYFSWREALYGFYSILSENKVLIQDNIHTAIANQNKIKQFYVASLCGIDMPKASITNHRNDILAMFDQNANVVLKTLHQLQLFHAGEKAMLLTKIVQNSDFSGFADEGECPLFLQHFVEKKYDLRVVFLGGNSMVFKIDASQSVHGRVDWRAYDLPNTPHSHCEDDNHEIADMVNKIANHMHLNFACFDFCVDAGGKYWLLDVNPFGKYLWLEKLTGAKITQAMANFIIAYSNKLKS